MPAIVARQAPNVDISHEADTWPPSNSKPRPQAAPVLPDCRRLQRLRRQARARQPESNRAAAECQVAPAHVAQHRTRCPPAWRRAVHHARQLGLPGSPDRQQRRRRSPVLENQAATVGGRSDPCRAAALPTHPAMTAPEKSKFAPESLHSNHCTSKQLGNVITAPGLRKRWACGDQACPSLE